MTSNYFHTYDGNENVSEYLNESGEVSAHYEYDPFGKTTVATGPKANDFAHRFSTKPLDATTGLYYYGYRFYDPLTGRWPSRDPIEERGGVNLYGFVGNDGIGWVDILGLDYLDVQIHCDLTMTIILMPGKGWMGNKDRAIHVADPDDEWPPKKIWRGKTGKLTQRDWRKKNGPTPPGWWRVGKEKAMADSERTGNMFDGKSTAFKLSFDFIKDRGYEQADRDYDSIRIHPDGGDNGTHGCVGISCADSEDFYNTITDPKLEVFVHYDKCCEIKGKEFLPVGDPKCCEDKY